MVRRYINGKQVTKSEMKKQSVMTPQIETAVRDARTRAAFAVPDESRYTNAKNGENVNG